MQIPDFGRVEGALWWDHPDDVTKSYDGCANPCLRKPESLAWQREVARRCLEIVEICVKPPGE